MVKSERLMSDDTVRDVQEVAVALQCAEMTLAVFGGAPDEGEVPDMAGLLGRAPKPGCDRQHERTGHAQAHQLQKTEARLVVVEQAVELVHRHAREPLESVEGIACIVEFAGDVFRIRFGRNSDLQPSDTAK